jgi:hypothetical protein
MDYDAIVAQALTLLQQEKRVAYRVLKRRLQLDNEIGASASVCETGGVRVLRSRSHGRHR